MSNRGKSPAGMNELLGSSGGRGEKSMKDLEELLGEKLPEIDPTPVGRIRLVNALKQRFGPGFRNIKGLKGILKEFDDMARFEIVKQRMRLIRVKGRS